MLIDVLMIGLGVLVVLMMSCWHRRHEARKGRDLEAWLLEDRSIDVGPVLTMIDLERDSMDDIRVKLQRLRRHKENRA